MRAVVSSTSPSGPHWRVAEVDEPELRSGDVLVRVVAAALNRADLLMRSGSYVPSDASWRVPTNRVGFELAGTTFRDRDLPELQDVTARLRAQPELSAAWGGVVPTIDSEFGLEAAEAAAERLASGQHAGKIVLLI